MEIKQTGQSKFGYYLKFSDDTFKGCTEAVSNFVKSRIPCEIEVTESDPKGVIQKVKILGQQNKSEWKPRTDFRSDWKSIPKEARDDKALTMLVSYAKDQVIAMINFTAEVSKNTEKCDFDVTSAWDLAIDCVWRAYEEFQSKMKEKGGDNGIERPKIETVRI